MRKPFEVILELKQHKYLTLDISTYINTATKARFIDIEYGDWWTRPSNVLNGKSHPMRVKLGVKPIPIEEIKRRLLLRQDGVTINESTYINTTTKAIFIDPVFGSWLAEPRTIIGSNQQYSHPSRGMLSRIGNKTKYKTEEDHKQRRVEASRKKRERSKTDIQFKLRNCLRTRLGMAIKNDWKVGSAVKDLGCTIEELKAHLESKFQPNMSWTNQGKHGWHIDHIVPLSSFDLTNREEFLKAVHYSNLQPLWAKDNLSKGGRVD